MRSRFFFSLVVSFGLLFAFGSVVAAQTWTPDVQVDDGGVVDGAVIIAKATVEGPAWVVIHADDGGNPGPVIGHAPLAAGENLQVVVEIDRAASTPVLHAMLHVDAGETGVYEFPGGRSHQDRGKHRHGEVLGRAADSAGFGRGDIAAADFDGGHADSVCLRRQRLVL